MSATVSLDWSAATVTVALASSEDVAVMVRSPPSASPNTPDRDAVAVRIPLSLTMVASPSPAGTVGARLAGSGYPPDSSSRRAAATGTQRSQPRSA